MKGREKIMKSNTIYPPMSEREISGAAISREAATQGMVLLKKHKWGSSVKGQGKIALFGNRSCQNNPRRNGIGRSF